MNEEEKKAINFLKETNFDYLDYDMCVSSVEIISNLIEKMQSCINILDNELKERNKTINEKEIIIEKLQKENEELKHLRDKAKLIVRDDAIRMYEQVEEDLESKITELQLENRQLKKDISNMYDEEVIINIICNEFHLNRDEALDLLNR